MSSFNTHSDAASIRSSSETTAATIFSMYEDHQFKSPAPPVPALDPRYSSRPPSGSVENSRGSQRNSREYEATVRQQQGYSASRMSSTSRRSYGQLDSQRPSMSHEPTTSSSYHTSHDSHHLSATGSGTLRPNNANTRTPPSPHISIQPNTAPPSTHSNPSAADLLTPATDTSRDRRTSSQTHTTAPTEYTTRGSTEDPDGYRVRATYARLEVEGVPGDGWLEGVERTRTRIVSAASAAVLEASRGVGGKGADVTEDEERRLRSTDRYGFFSTPAPRHEGRLALLPATAFQRLPSTSKQPPIPTPPNAIPPLPQIHTIPPPTHDPREQSRIAKWERMLVASTTPGSGGRGSGGGWKWDARKVKKKSERVFKGVPDRWRSAAWGTMVEERAGGGGGGGGSGGRVGLGELARRYRVRLPLCLIFLGWKLMYGRRA
ncbi:hypothetical protein FRC07_010710 [Ceratobasidium sp. 392]|nr:hypothetical protein FRC07_010710 [Ceratobasidium sp. 392]